MVETVAGKNANTNVIASNSSGQTSTTTMNPSALEALRDAVLRTVRPRRKTSEPGDEKGAIKSTTGDTVDTGKDNDTLKDDNQRHQTAEPPNSEVDREEGELSDESESTIEIVDKRQESKKENQRKCKLSFLLPGLECRVGSVKRQGHSCTLMIIWYKVYYLLLR